MSESSITQFQEVVAHVFFALPEADSFLLAAVSLWRLTA